MHFRSNIFIFGAFGILAGGAVGFLATKPRNLVPEGNIEQTFEIPRPVPLRSIDSITLPEMKAAVSDYAVWKERENRVLAISAYFASVARESGSAMAVNQGLSIFSSVQIPDAIRDATFEALIISAFREKRPTDDELRSILSQSNGLFGPCVRGIASAVASGNTCVEKYLELEEIVKSPTVELGLEKNRLIVRAAVLASSALDLESLTTLAEKVGRGNRVVLSEIVKAAGVSDVALAIQFSKEFAKDDFKLFVELILVLELDKASIGAITARLDKKSLAPFAEAYIDATPLDIRARVNLSAHIEPSLLTEKSRAAVAVTLNVDSAIKWIGQLPEADRVKLMLSMNQGAPRNVNSTYWLAIASQISGIPESAYHTAVRDAAYTQTLEQLEPYLAKLTPEHRQKEVLEFHLREFRTLNLKNADEMVALVESKPEEYRAQFYQAVSSTLVRKSGRDALELYEKTENPKLKSALERSLLNSDISAEDYWKIAGREIAAANPDTISTKAHTYVEKLLKSDSDKALKFTLALPESPLRDGAMRVLAREWATKNPETASEWITQLPSGSSRDVALYELVKSSKDEVESAFGNISAMSSAGQRLVTATEVVEWWKKKDPKKIEEMISSSTFSEQERSFLLKRLKQ